LVSELTGTSKSPSFCFAETTIEIRPSRRRFDERLCCSFVQGLTHLGALAAMPYPSTILLVTSVVATCTALTSAYAGITWEVPLSTSGSQCTCDKRGVLKLTFNTRERRCAEITMLFENSNEWSFNIGDSRTNNGYAGDAGTQSNDAEVNSRSKTIMVFGRDNPSGGSYGNQAQQPNFLDGVVRMTVADNHFRADNGDSIVSVNNDRLFRLNGQADSEGPVNHDVYVGLNRVVQSTSRVGTGLCWVGVKWRSSCSRITYPTSSLPSQLSPFREA
ncbi:hypothetical protein BaRGS_00031313, partial [Batillaria attramentaria]